MRIALFGATGRTGRLVVAAAQASGHEIVAYVRPGSQASGVLEGAETVVGDLEDSGAIARCVDGADAVVCTLGTTDRKPNHVLSDGTRLIVEAMEGKGVARLVCVTSLGCGDSRAQVRSWFMRLIIRTFAKEIWADKDRQEAIVTKSDLDYLLVRPGGLTEKPGNGVWRLLAAHEPAPGSQMIARADVAAYCLSEAVAPSRHRTAVTLLPPS